MKVFWGYPQNLYFEKAVNCQIRLLNLASSRCMIGMRLYRHGIFIVVVFAWQADIPPTFHQGTAFLKSESHAVPSFDSRPTLYKEQGRWRLRRIFGVLADGKAVRQHPKPRL
jgi:hypothetical protein